MAADPPSLLNSPPGPGAATMSSDALEATYQKIESQLTPRSKQAVDKIEVAGMHAGLENGPNGILAALRRSKDPVGDAARGAVAMVLILRHQAQASGRGLMPEDSMASAGALLMIRALDFVNRIGLVKIDNDQLVRATHIFTNAMFAALKITPAMLAHATAQVHAITQNPQAVQRLNQQVGAEPHPNAEKVPMPGGA